MERWVANPNSITKEIKEQLNGLYVDTAAVGVAAILRALRLVGRNHVVYGADCEVTTEENAQNTWRMRDSPKRRTLSATTSKCCLQRP